MHKSKAIEESEEMDDKFDKTKSEDIILSVKNLKMHFPVVKGSLRRNVGWVKAVDNVSFDIKEGETLGLVGESGCGKSTCGRTIMRLLKQTDGKVLFGIDGKKVDLSTINDKIEMQKFRRKMQIIFQDPFSSLDPRMTVRDIIGEPLRAQKIGTKQERYERVKELMELVGLNAWQFNQYPHEFSGGQRQRVGIARALALNPDLIICDEPVSALDVSVQAQILNLLEDLQKKLNLTYLFIAHDLSVVEHISDRVMVMYLGKIVEIAKSEELYEQPLHPYTEALLKAIPASHPKNTRKRETLPGNLPDPSNPPGGCNFHLRCKYSTDLCAKEEPLLKELNGSDHSVACHYAETLSLDGFESSF